MVVAGWFLNPQMVLARRKLALAGWAWKVGRLTVRLPCRVVKPCVEQNIIVLFVQGVVSMFEGVVRACFFSEQETKNPFILHSGFCCSKERWLHFTLRCNVPAVDTLCRC